MRKIVFVIFLLTFGIISNAQLLRDPISGSYYVEQRDIDLRGTPFLYDEWRPAYILYSDGLQLKNVQVKFSVYKNKPLFNRNDSLFEFVKEVDEFILYNPEGDSVIFRKGYAGMEGITAKTYLQVVQEGKVGLVKLLTKQMIERKEFNSATPIIELSSTSGTLYLVQGDKLVKVKKDDDALKQTMKDKWDVIAAYVKQNKLSLKKEQDIATVVQYYNSL
jgi:hypothetical protein